MCSRRELHTLWAWDGWVLGTFTPWAGLYSGSIEGLGWCLCPRQCAPCTRIAGQGWQLVVAGPSSQYLISMSTHLDTYTQCIYHRPMRPCPLSAATAGFIRKKTDTQSFTCTHATYHTVTHAFMFVGRLELECVHMSGPTCVQVSGPYNACNVRACLWLWVPAWYCSISQCWSAVVCLWTPMVVNV
jgi:hypothetical protein